MPRVRPHVQAVLSPVTTSGSARKTRSATSGLYPCTSHVAVHVQLSRLIDEATFKELGHLPNISRTNEPPVDYNASNMDVAARRVTNSVSDKMWIMVTTSVPELWCWLMAREHCVISEDDLLGYVVVSTSASSSSFWWIFCHISMWKPGVTPKICLRALI